LYPGDRDEDDESFEEKAERLMAELCAQLEESRNLDAAIWRNLEELGYDE
jgi:hypothetical protein